MRKISIALVFLLCSCVNTFSQEVVKLWDTTSSSDNGITEKERVEREGAWVTNIAAPEMHIYKPTVNKNGKVVVVCPGGGYAGLAINHEGKLFAEWLNQRGIAAVVLKYRMPNKHKDVPLADAQQAIRYVRENAEKLGVDKAKVGIAGFSAGGHLASTASTHYATEGTSTRPDFTILFYPVITMGKATHAGSKLNLLGDKPSEVDVLRFSNEKQVTVNTPPTILLLSDDDKVVLPENSVRYYSKLKKNDIAATMYIFPEGGHGWGFRDTFKYHKEMSALLEMWLDGIN